MVQIHILSNDILQSKEIAEFLMREKLIIDVSISENHNVITLENDELTIKKNVLITGKTKALLFQEIDNRIK